jgi:CheY-like chemotaxis protein
MHQKRVLIIDDEPDIWEMTQITLQTLAGWDVVGTGCGEDGIRLAQAEQPDVILLDVMMPDMDGPTTFIKLRSIPETRHIPVILLTAKVKDARQGLFDQLGADGLISKPFNAAQLADRIAEILGWSVV